MLLAQVTNCYNSTNRYHWWMTTVLSLPIRNHFVVVKRNLKHMTKPYCIVASGQYATMQTLNQFWSPVQHVSKTAIKLSFAKSVVLQTGTLKAFTFKNLIHKRAQHSRKAKLRERNARPRSPLRKPKKKSLSSLARRVGGPRPYNRENGPDRYFSLSLSCRASARTRARGARRERAHAKSVMSCKGSRLSSPLSSARTHFYILIHI